MLDTFFSSLSLVIRWPSFGYLLLGIFVGGWIGMVPGLGGLLSIILLLPFIYGMDPVAAFALLLGSFAVTSTTDTVASVMLGVPGTSASQATILDGYPLAQKGEAARALGAAFTVSAFGGVFGAIVLAASLPIILPVILKFNNPEMFMLSVLAISLVGSLSGGSISKGLAAGCLGLLFSTIGYSEGGGIPRFWLGSTYLLDSLPLIPVVLGLFAVPELMELGLHNRSIASVSAKQDGYGMLFQGIRDAFKYWWLSLRCAIIGTYIGALPGLGGAIVDWVAYGHAVQSTKKDPHFGKGDIRGVIAPEAANNAVRGGSLLPTIAFGIPGSTGNALLLGALLIVGLRPGQQMLTSQLHVTFSMVWSIVLANIISAVLLMILTKQVVKVAFVPGHLLIPGVTVLVFMGAWVSGSTMGAWVTLVVISILGYLMKQGGWPRPPIILAFILGRLMEDAFNISQQVHQGPGWLLRPIVLVILVLIIATLFFSGRSIIRRRRKEKLKTDEKSDDARIIGEGMADNPIISVVLGSAMILAFVMAAIETTHWEDAVDRLFPQLAAIPGALLVLMALCTDFLNIRQKLASKDSLKKLYQRSSVDAQVTGALKYFAYFFSLIPVSYIIGQKLALPIFVAIYLICWGKYSFRLAVLYASIAWVFMIVLYERILHILWHQSYLSELLRPILPDAFPMWLIL